MKKLILAFALAAASATAPAFAGNVAFSITVGEPGFYGQIDIGGYGRPRLIYSEPVILAPRYRYYEPIYVRAPYGHYQNWGRYCGRYSACGRPVYFVRDEWYRDVYAPRYRQHHSDRREWRDDRRDYRDHRYDDDYDRYDRRKRR